MLALPLAWRSAELWARAGCGQSLEGGVHEGKDNDVVFVKALIFSDEADARQEPR